MAFRRLSVSSCLRIAVFALCGAATVQLSAIDKEAKWLQQLTFREQRLLEKMLAKTPKTTKESQTIVEPRIVGGDTAASGDYPWMVGLLDRATSDRFQAQYCGASLIHPYWVLTAAHCVDGDSPEVIDALVGGYNLNSSTEGERIEVVEIIMHPDYDPNTLDSDVALLRLATPASAPVLRLNSDAALEQPDTLAAVIGWGALDEENTSFPAVLNDVFVPLVSLGDANASNRYNGTLTTNMLAAGNLSEGGVDSCQGDSGGPLVLEDIDGEWTLSGIVSFGNGCANPDFPGIYTRVSQIRSWVLRHVLPEYADWEIEQDVFGEARDFDEDTQSNFYEFSLDLNPRQMDGGGVNALTVDGQAAFQLSRPMDGGAEVAYRLLYKASLSDLSWTELDYESSLAGSDVVDDRELLTFDFPAANAGFVKVEPKEAQDLAFAPRWIPLGRPSYSNLTSELRRDEFGRLYQEFLVTDTSGGETLTITGVSNDFDLGVELYDYATGVLLGSFTADNFESTSEQFEYTPSSGFIVRVFSETSIGQGAYWILVGVPSSGTVDTIGQNDTINDSLTTSDEVDPIYSGGGETYYKKDYFLDTPDGYNTAIEVTLTSSDFDAYLMLVHATTGALLDENDDINAGAGNYNSSLTIAPSNFGNVLIRVTTAYGSETGSFTLTTNPI